MSAAPAPAVSVVIPTFQRPGLVLTAVRSALAQTLPDLEVIVVVDGRDPETCAALKRLADPRVIVHVPDRHLGNADARNAGIALARASWVAFLDDDDIWLPPKLERQLRAARRSSAPLPVVSCRMLARGSAGDSIWPRRLPEPDEDWSEYFFCRRTPFTGEGMVTFSALLVPRDLLLRVPLTSELGRHVDPDWLLRAAQVPGVRLEFDVEGEPLLIWHIEHTRDRITTRRNWLESWAWCRENRNLFSPRGYAAFLLHVVGSNAAAQHAWGAFPRVLREAFRRGRPAAVDLASYFASFAIPAPIQRRVAAWYGRRSA